MIQSRKQSRRRLPRGEFANLPGTRWDGAEIWHHANIPNDIWHQSDGFR